MARTRSRRYRSGRRAPLRKFIWARSTGFLDRTVLGADLLGQFQQEYGAQLLGATVVRIKGWVVPNSIGGGADGQQMDGLYGMIVDQDRADYSLANNAEMAVEQREHDDWLYYSPWVVHNYTSAGFFRDVTPNPMASPWAVDIKSSRKIEELGQTLQIWQSTPTAVTPDYTGTGFHLSIGLKLP